MSTRLARLALSLYPLAFRHRYGEELRVLLDDCPSGPRGLLDLLRGALVAHLRPAPGLSEGMDVDMRLRLGLAGTLACWMLFAAAGFAFYITSEDHPFIVAGSAHPLLVGAHLTVQALAVLASLAVVAGALPLVYFAIRQARRQRDRLRAIVSVPIAAMLAFILITCLLVRLAHSHPSLAHSHPSSGLAQGAFLAWCAAGLLCGGVCVVAAREALFRIGVARAWLVGALWSATFVLMAMLAMTCATALYAIALVLDAPGLTNEGNGPFQLVNVGVSLIVMTVGMALLTALAAGSVCRTWRCLRRESAPADAR